MGGQVKVLSKLTEGTQFVLSLSTKSKFNRLPLDPKWRDQQTKKQNYNPFLEESIDNKEFEIN